MQQTAAAIPATERLLPLVTRETPDRLRGELRKLPEMEYERRFDATAERNAELIEAVSELGSSAVGATLFALMLLEHQAEANVLKVLHEMVHPIRTCELCDQEVPDYEIVKGACFGCRYGIAALENAVIAEEGEIEVRACDWCHEEVEAIGFEQVDGKAVCSECRLTPRYRDLMAKEAAEDHAFHEAYEEREA